jgi:hypothetical protein
VHGFTKNDVCCKCSGEETGIIRRDVTNTKPIESISKAKTWIIAILASVKIDGDEINAVKNSPGGQFESQSEETEVYDSAESAAVEYFLIGSLEYFPYPVHIPVSIFGQVSELTASRRIECVDGWKCSSQDQE